MGGLLGLDYAAVATVAAAHGVALGKVLPAVQTLEVSALAVWAERAAARKTGANRA